MPGWLSTAWQWLGQRDAGYAASRRAARTAIIMPALFAIGDKVIGNPVVATFAAFGSFAMLLLVDFSGTRRERAAAQLALVLTGAAFVCLGTLVSRSIWLATLGMLIVAFLVLFAGVVSSVLAGASTSLLLGFILPTTLVGPVSSIPDRLEGWLLAGAVSIVAITVLWPAPTRDPLRGLAAQACQLLALRLEAGVDYILGRSELNVLQAAVSDSDDAVARLRTGFFGTPYRPTGLTTSARTVVRLVDELVWLNTILDRSPIGAHPQSPDVAVCSVKTAAAGVLARGATLLREPDHDLGDLDAELRRLRDALADLEQAVTNARPAAGDSGEPGMISALEPSFRAQEMTFAISAIAANIELSAAAQQRSWCEKVLGHQPDGVGGPLAAARARAGAHLERHSVWLHNSIRGAIALALAVYIAEKTGVQHSFWVVLGTLSVLRSNALNTGQNAVRGLIGTTIGFVVGGLLVVVIGTNTTLLWFLLPVAILVAGLAPAISFAAGQGGFTVTLLILYNIIAPTGWKVGLIRVEDVALGCVVSLVVGVLFWPRGASAALGRALSDAYADSAAFLRQALTASVTSLETGPTEDQAAAAARRLDDAFRNFLAERGTKRLPLATVSSLITGVAGLRLTAAAVLELWGRAGSPAAEPGAGWASAPAPDRAVAADELIRAGDLVVDWYEAMSRALIAGSPVADPLPPDRSADGRLVEAVRRDLGGGDRTGGATAVRMIWTGDHIDAARRLQGSLVEPARAVAALSPGYGS